MYIVILVLSLITVTVLKNNNLFFEGFTQPTYAIGIHYIDYFLISKILAVIN